MDNKHFDVFSKTRLFFSRYINDCFLIVLSNMLTLVNWKIIATTKVKVFKKLHVKYYVEGENSWRKLLAKHVELMQTVVTKSFLLAIELSYHWKIFDLWYTQIWYVKRIPYFWVDIQMKSFAAVFLQHLSERTTNI